MDERIEAARQLLVTTDRSIPQIASLMRFCDQSYFTLVFRQKTGQTPGQYRADLVAYVFDDDGNEDILDGVYPGFVFTIRNRLDGRHYLDWHHQYWGHVRLHDMSIRKI